MKVLSLFDGMSCGQIALSKLGIPVSTFYASEIDKFAIKVTQKNFPDTIQLGDATNWQYWDIDFSTFDLIIGGSPCQGFSMAGKKLAFEDPRSKLFFTFVDILNHVKSLNPKVKFLLENVRMKKEHLDVISSFVNVTPIAINSCLVSAQNRIRYYWTNLDYSSIENKNIKVKDILDEEIQKETIQGERWHTWFFKNKDFQLAKKYNIILNDVDKAITMTARQYANWGGNFVEIDPSKLNFIGGFTKGSRIESENCLSRNFREGARVYDVEGKAATLTSQSKGSLGGYSGLYGKVEEGQVLYRRLSVKECCRLQTVPDNYFEGSGVSSSQAYKMLGNGWTVDVIVEFLRGLK
jgi:DNA (cytosine-5)-methyltransferase 3A